MKHLPNTITLLRILLSTALIFLIDQPIMFFLIYFSAGITDMLDGFVARRFQVMSEFGARLDSIADMWMFLICMLILIQTNIEIPMELVLSIGLIGGIRLINVIITRVRFRRFSIMHTTLNKTTGLSLWLLFPWLIFPIDLTHLFSKLVVLLAFLSAIEEMLIVLKTKSYNVNQRHWMR